MTVTHHCDCHLGFERHDVEILGATFMLGATPDVRALPASDSAFGCRQMIGNLWEWTADNLDRNKLFVGFRTCAL